MWYLPYVDVRGVSGSVSQELGRELQHLFYNFILHVAPAFVVCLR